MAPLVRFDGANLVQMDPSVRLVTSDADKVESGTLFVDVPRHVADRTTLLRQAIERGAIGIITDLDAHPGTPPAIPLIRVPHPRRALAACAARLSGDPGQRMTCVGVTGTSGKTSTVEYVLALFRAAGKETDAIGSLHPIQAGDPWPLTTPSAPDVQAALAGMVARGVEACALEVSSHGIEQERVAAIPFAAGILTNLGRDHLDYHGSLPAYWETKARFFRALAPDAVAILPTDRNVETAITPGVMARIVRYGESEGDVRLLDAGAYTRSRRRVTIQTPTQTIRTDLRTPGPGAIRSALAIAALGFALGMDPEVVARGISSVREIAGRMQRIRAEGRQIWIDYAHNPAGLEVCLRGVREATPGRIFLVFGGRGHRDRGKLPAMGLVAGRFADEVILTSDSPGHDDPADLAREIQSGLRHLGKSAPFIVDRIAAIASAFERSHPGDSIVLTGRGPELIRQIGDETVQGSDADLVNKALREVRRFQAAALREA